MTEKIKWYKEVLELEPNSKVFFPLARMLAEAGQADEAVQVLEHGLERHAEFLEARLFLIELLYRSKGQQACLQQVEKLGSMFSEYAGFWQAWAACLSSAQGKADTATVLHLLAAYFMKGSLSLHDVLNRGIDSLMQESGPCCGVSLAAAQAPCTQTQPQGQNTARSASTAASAAEMPQTVAAEVDSLEPLEEDFGEKFDPAAAMVADDPAADAGTDHAGTGEEQASVSMPEAVQADATGPDMAEGDDAEEPFSLRTRSMAEVLAEQGDVKGALDIYSELAAAAVSPEESADLKQRMHTLQARLNAVPEVHIEEEPDVAKGKEKLISMLEALAQRVEARAGH